MISVKGLEKAFGTNLVLKGINEDLGSAKKCFYQNQRALR